MSGEHSRPIHYCDVAFARRPGHRSGVLTQPGDQESPTLRATPGVTSGFRGCVGAVPGLCSAMVQTSTAANQQANMVEVVTWALVRSRRQVVRLCRVADAGSLGSPSGCGPLVTIGLFACAVGVVVQRRYELCHLWRHIPREPRHSEVGPRQWGVRTGEAGAAGSREHL
jgi:hypothetical protein